ncbi:unnamed protein product [Rhizophagus irregularis]|nr:unnamed protein product [Rhizophagus irregularis]
MKNVWQQLTIKIKNEYGKLLQDIDASTISIIPLNLIAKINDQDGFMAFLEAHSDHNEKLKQISFKVECSQQDFSAYKKFSQLESIFGVSIERMNELPQLELPPSADMSSYDENINLAVACIKLILRTSGSIDECENEAERTDFVATILRGVVSTFDENYNIKMRREFNISGTYGKGHTDFAITYIKKIFCVTEVKVSDLEYGFCENFIQVQTACQHNLKDLKRKRDQNDFEYVYGMVTTGDKWYFTMVTSENKFAAVTKEPLILGLHKVKVDDDHLKSEVTELFATIRGILLAKINDISPEEPNKKGQRGYITTIKKEDLITEDNNIKPITKELDIEKDIIMEEIDTVAIKEEIKQTEGSMEIEETTTTMNINQGIITIETNVRTTVIMDNNQQMNMQQEQIIYQLMDDDKDIMDIEKASFRGRDNGYNSQRSY